MHRPVEKRDSNRGSVVMGFDLKWLIDDCDRRLRLVPWCVGVMERPRSWESVDPRPSIVDGLGSDCCHL